MTHFNEGTAILAVAVIALGALTVLSVRYMIGSFTKATPYEFGKLAEIAGRDPRARDKVRKLRARKAVTLRDVNVCASEIEDMLDRKDAARALARLGK